LDAIKRTKSKFILLYEEKFIISKVFLQSDFGLKDENGRARKKIRKKSLK